MDPVTEILPQVVEYARSFRRRSDPQGNW